MGWFNFFNYILWGLVFQGFRVIIDFWLRSKVDPSEDNHFFDSLNKIFENNFKDTFTFLLGLSIIAIIIRNIFYVVSSN
jgi:ABC-type multidrug transport system fused ATPase/permease subunit